MPKHRGSWVALVTFCAANVLAAALGFALLLASATLAFAVAQSLKPSPRKQAGAHYTASAKTFVGMITDSDCGARHAKDSGSNSAECVRACVRKGAKYTLVDGDKIYRLEGNRAELDALAGQRTRVVGSLDGSTIKVNSVAAASGRVKDPPPHALTPPAARP